MIIGQILDFLRHMEEHLPPPPNSHHAITRTQYGSDETGWEERLAIQVNLDGKFLCFFLDAEDLEKAPESLVAEIVTLAKNPPPNTQLGVSSGRYI